MSETEIKSTSGRLPVVMLNAMLKMSIKPQLVVGGGHLHSSRRSMDRWGKWLPAIKGVSVKKETLAGMPCEVHTPVGSHSNRVILYMHGGGFCVGSAVSHRNLVSRIADSAAIKTIAMDYRLAPEHPYPGPLDDTVKLYRYCLDQGYKPGNILFAGDSAGGNLVLTTLIRLRDEGVPLPAAACAISPWCDLTMSGTSIQANAGNDLILSHQLLQDFASCYVTPEQRKLPHVSPAFADFSGLPPLLIQVGGAEVLLDDARAAARRAEAAGVDVQLEVWEGMQHVWHYSAFLLQDGRRAITHMATFFASHLD